MLSVLVPVYNEQDNIGPFYERCKPVLEGLGVDWELVYVNDGSADGSLSRILALRKEDPRVKVITLSRNFGYHSVLVAGLTLRQSDLYAIIDVDCEDPPELLKEFLGAIKDGAYTAYGERSKRDEPAWVIFLRYLFYLINNKIADAPTKLWMAEFVMIRRAVRDAILANRSTFPFLRAEMAYVGYKTVGVSYFRESRRHGRSHYNLWSMSKFAIAGFLSSSTLPLRALVYLSLGMGALYALLVAMSGFNIALAAALAAVLGFLYLLAAAPVLGLYLARDYKNVIGRPVFFTDPEQTFLDT
ncbi:MAG: glycosyltransferase family 2 protein [Elusimicrobiota bacterium]